MVLHHSNVSRGHDRTPDIGSRPHRVLHMNPIDQCSQERPGLSLRYRGSLVPLLLLAVLVSSVGCGQSKDELIAYLTHDFVRLTAGTVDVVAAFQAILDSSATPQKKAQNLQNRVVAPYQKIVRQLETLKPQTDPVRARHAEYTALARRQLSAFVEARRLLLSGRSLRDVAERLNQTRIELERWQTAIKQDANNVGVPLNE
jgi:hypothetical protein